MDYDFVVIGAGPVGSLLAQRLTQGGASVLIIEDMRKLGGRFNAQDW